MKTGSKAAVGILAALLMLCVVSAVALFVSKTGQRIRGFATGVAQVAGEARGLDRLNREHPFSPPGGGEVPEARLQAYIRVCEELKPEADRYDAWMRSHENQSRKEQGIGEAQEGVALVGQMMKATASALQCQAMGPQEFQWIRRAMRSARRETAGRESSALEDEMLNALREAAGAPGLSPAERAKLTAQIQSFQARVGAAGRPLGANDRLYLRYASQLAQCELGEEALSLIGGFEHGRGKAARVEISR